MPLQTQTVSFFELAPELRNAIYAAVIATMDKHALFKKAGFGDGKTSLNDMVIPGLLFTCRQALQEGMGIFNTCKSHYHLDIHNTHLPSVSTTQEHIIVKAEDDDAAEASTAIYRLLRPSTDAVLRIAPNALQIKSLSLRVCLQNDRVWSISELENGKRHQLVFLEVTFGAAGDISLCGTVNLLEACIKCHETTVALTLGLSKALEERMKHRSNKWLEYQDLELVLELCYKYSKCWCVRRCVL